MATDPSVIAAILIAVDADPTNISLRSHLISLLLEGKQFAEALRHCAIILDQQPDHLEALDQAARAAEALGDGARAKAYRRLRDALTGGAGDRREDKAQDEEPPPLRLPQRAPQGDPDDNWDDIVTTDDEDASSDRVWDVERPRVTLADVAGLEQVKRRLDLAFLSPLKNPEVMKMYGKSLRGGLMLYGPPGCGKTFIARATAGELGARFVSIGLSDVLDMWIGSSEKNLHQIFETARRNRPCVLFFDEVDALGQKRSQQKHSGSRNVVNQLLAELDGAEHDNEGLFVLAATNHPWDVDTALRRPGRLDRALLVLPPDAAARAAILRYHLRDRPQDKSLDFNWLASHTDEFSGADLAHLCDSAAELAMEESLLRGTARPITMADFKKATREIRQSTRSWFETARNYAMFANEGGLYDDLLEYLRARRML